MEAKASHYAARCAPRKVRLLRPLVIGKSVADAIATLSTERRCGSVPAIKLFRSAMAQLPGSVAAAAIITEFMVNEGPKRRMYMPRARGRALPIIKRSAHMFVRLKVAE
jgi:large subunit ribosomal protein L22